MLCSGADGELSAEDGRCWIPIVAEQGEALELNGHMRIECIAQALILGFFWDNSGEANIFLTVFDLKKFVFVAGFLGRVS